MIFISLINNIALLIAISILYSIILRKWYYETRIHQIISGFLFGIVTIIGMMNPFVWTNGIIFDGRSIIISVAGFFGGPLTAAITASIAVIFRIYIGGLGVYMGCTVIAGSALIGVIFHYLRSKNTKYDKPLQMYFFSLIVHAYMMVATVALPSQFTTEALYLFSVPVLVLYPLGSLLVCILFQDLISKIKTEIALKDSEANYRELIEDVNSLVLRLDSSFLITFLNNYAKKILSDEKDSLIGKNFLSEVLNQQSNDAETNFKFFFSKKNNSRSFFESEINCSDGSVYWIAWSFNPVYSDSGFIVEILCVGTDITERKKSEEERLRLQHLESLGILAGGIAHDFNNILTVIMGKSSLALLTEKDEKIKGMLNSISDATGRARGLTQQLLTFAKGGAPEKKVIDLNKTIKEITKFSVSGSNANVDFSFSHKLSLEADPTQISQVIQNIVINAVQAMPGGGKIAISTKDVVSDNLPYVRISISDEGLGIPKENLVKIFDPYFTTKQTGTGLGLSVCHSIVNRHGGKLLVDSKPGEGTLFQILLPASNADLKVEEERTEKSTKKLKILIMDDEQDILELLSGMLRYLGHEVSVCNTGMEALEIIRQNYDSGSRLDLSILDYTIKGGMGGLDTAVEIKKIDPSIRIIISSGYLDTSIKEKVGDKSIETLDKPYTIQKVKDKIALLFSGK